MNILAPWRERVSPLGNRLLDALPAADYERLRPELTREVAVRAVTAGWAPVSVRPSMLGTRATVVGAARTALQAVLEHPARWLASRPDQPNGPVNPGRASVR